MQMIKVLFLSDDEMMMYAGGQVHRLHSERMERYIRTARSLEERNAWKYEGAGAKFQQQNPYEHLGRIAESECRVQAIAPWRGRLLYALTTPDMGGLYVKDSEDDAAPESSWLSERGLHAADLHVQGDQVALALDMGSDERHIALMRADTARYEVITQGDTRDSSPFLSRDGRTLYYASAGLARDEHGFSIAQGPGTLLRMNLPTGDLEEIAGDAQFDYIRPKEGPDGTLYCIRRPYKQPVPRKQGLLQRVKNVAAVFRGLGRLLRFIGDPQGAARQEPQPSARAGQAAQTRMFDGVRLEIAPARGADGREAGCIPDDWVLGRLTETGDFEELHKGVADYAFSGSALVISDGRRLLRMEDGKCEVLCRAAYIPRIAVIE